MVEKKIIGIGSAISGGAILIGLFLFMFTSGQNYYMCENREELGIGTCDAFSKYVSENGKCINYTMFEILENGSISSINLGNKICREGWVKINMTDFDPYSDLAELLYDLDINTGLINVTNSTNKTININTTIIQYEYVPRMVHILLENNTVKSIPYNNNSYITMRELYNIVKFNRLLFDFEEK